MHLVIRRIVTAATFAFVAGSMVAYADTIGPNCGSCFGSVYTLTNDGLKSSTALTETYRYSYTIDTSKYNGPTRGTDYIASLALKVSSSVYYANLVSGAGTGNWSLKYGGLSNDCDGGFGWLCIQGGKAYTGSLTPYTWVFDITMAKGSLLSNASIKANYDPPNGLVMSENLGTPVNVPEGSVVELPLAIAALGFWLYWSKRSQSASPSPVLVRNV